MIKSKNMHFSTSDMIVFIEYLCLKETFLRMLNETHNSLTHTYFINLQILITTQPKSIYQIVILKPFFKLN